tara:strand:+ start:593 stop:877 length:285 start_codon:yes stop_codon:yes gene_type:complete
MIILQGDFIKLTRNFYGDNSEWYRVDQIEVYDICLLSNGVRVPASKEYISNVKSSAEYEALEYDDAEKLDISLEELDALPLSEVEKLRVEEITT